MRASAIAAIVIVIIAVAAGGAYLAVSRSQGSVYVYISDPGRGGNVTTTGIYLTVTSIMVHSASTGKWLTITNRTITVLLSSVPQAVAQANLPPGVYNEVRLYVSSVTVQLGSVNVSAKLPSNALKIPIVNGGLNVTAGRRAYLVISMGPHVTQAAGGYIVSPVAVAYAYYAPPNTTTNTTA
ncbi:hypothetical protein ASAC_0527 [Acidilobus saccharovorans 345-15]|uniref:DUF4382 domain-containing protein n=1 Tax=Acidilobus saccharovorans (strain DSM 16705 / JCM 18335 / VKM B-2471 / 345-15) TaxID=666510 RepID=D9Q0U6_ACIS3|nr:hypothetical protein ASAC_0527 [Acidilobus saccharovorans 345-15]